MIQAEVSREIDPGTPSPSPKTVLRVGEIDGIRGWAALAVVVFHLWMETFGKVHPGFAQPAYYFFFDGPLSVYIFFILSGDALSTHLFSTRSKRSLDKMVLKRYFRLSIPIFLMTALTMGALWAHLTENVAAGRVVHRDDWLGTFYGFHWSVGDLLTFPFLHVFGGQGGAGSFNTFLWTMPVELVGSILVFLYLYLHERLRRPLAVIIALIAFTFFFQPYYSLFFIGVLFAYLRASGSLDRIRGKVAVRVVGPLLALSAYLLEYFLRKTPPVTGPSGFVDHVRIAVQDNEKFIMAGLFVTGIYLSKDLCALFRGRLSQFLGRVSFPIYLLQFLVLCTFTSHLIIRYQDRLGSHLVCLAISGASVGVTVLSGFLFSIIEKRCMKLLDRGVSAIIAPGADDRPRAGRSAAVSVAASPAPVALADDWRNDGRVVMTEGVGIGGRVALRGSDLRGVGHGSLGRGAGGCPGGDDGRPETPTDGGRAGIGDEPTDEQPLTARRTLVLEADLA